MTGTIFSSKSVEPGIKYRFFDIRSDTGFTCIEIKYLIY